MAGAGLEGAGVELPRSRALDLTFYVVGAVCGTICAGAFLVVVSQPEPEMVECTAGEPGCIRYEVCDRRTGLVESSSVRREESGIPLWFVVAVPLVGFTGVGLLVGRRHRNEEGIWLLLCLTTLTVLVWAGVTSNVWRPASDEPPVFTAVSCHSPGSTEA